jgi:hypothetical protein
MWPLEGRSRNHLTAVLCFGWRSHMAVSGWLTLNTAQPSSGFVKSKQYKTELVKQYFAGGQQLESKPSNSGQEIRLWEHR